MRIVGLDGSPGERGDEMTGDVIGEVELRGNVEERSVSKGGRRGERDRRTSTSSSFFWKSCFSPPLWHNHITSPTRRRLLVTFLLQDLFFGSVWTVGREGGLGGGMNDSELDPSREA